MQATRKEKGLLSRGLYSIIRYNKNALENNVNTFIDVFDIDKSLFLKINCIGKGTYNFLKENPMLVKQTILNSRYYISHLGYLTKKELPKEKENKIKKVLEEKPKTDCNESENETTVKNDLMKENETGGLLWIIIMFALLGGNETNSKEFKKIFEDYAERTIIMSDTKTNKCVDCESKIALKYVELETELNKYKRYNKILNDCLDTKDELCKMLGEDNENLRYKNELYLEKIRKLEGSDD